MLDRDGRAQASDLSESTSRVNTPTPGTLPVDTHAPQIAPLTLELASPSTNAPNYDSSTDTEPDETETRLHTAFSSFNSYHTVDTSPAVSERKLSSHSAPANPSGLMADTPGLRRSISADRLTMRPSNSPIPPPLNRTRSDGLGLTIGRGPGKLDLPSAPSVSVDVPRTQTGDIAHVNHVLRRLNTRRAYPGQADTYYTSTDTESDDHRRGLSTPPSPRTVSYTTKEKGKWKATDPYSSPSLQYEELPSPGLLSASFHRFTFGPSEDTDDDRRYETVSEGISDAEDFDIPTSIPTTTTLPPLPAPTVSRSRSSSRSFPSPVPGNDIPPVPPLPPFALLGSRMRAASSPRLVSSSLARSVASDQRSFDQRSLKTPTPTQSLTPLPTSPSSASISSTTSLLSGIPPDGITNRSRSSRNPSPRLGNSSASEKRRQRSISESGGHSGAGSSSGGGSRGRFATLANALRKSPNPSPGRGIEHIKPEPPKPRSRPKYTIAFIGSAGCGKTTLIEKGSKLSNQKYKPHVALKSVRYNDFEMTCKYETREASIVVDKTRSAYPAYAVEFDSAPFIKALETGGKFWPETMPAIDGVVLCYNASREGNESGSFNHIQRLSAAFVALRYPITWVACKSDWIRPPVNKDGQATSPRVLPEGIISPQTVYQQAASEQIGLIEVAKSNAYGKERMRNLLTWMYKAIARAQRERLSGEQGQEYHNHASPEVFDRKPAVHSKPAPIIVPTRSSLAAVPYTPAPSSPALKSPASPTTLLTPPTRARSMSDLLSQAARDQVAGASAAVLRKASANISSVHLPRPTLETTESQLEGIKTPESQRPSQGDIESGTPSAEHSTSVLVLKPKIEPDPFAFATLDTLIKRLLGGISPGPTPEFTAGFCLTFRKFASPRSVLLGMIRYLRSVEGDSKTRALPLLNCYLRLWIGDYPTDFGAPGAIAPLEKLIGIIGEELSEESGRELRARVDLLYDVADEAKDWAKPTEGFTDDDSDTEGDSESRPNSTEIPPPSSSPLTVMVNTTTVVDQSPSDALKPRSPETRQPSPIPPEPPALSERELHELQRVSKQLLAQPPEHIAQEVTLRDLELFWAIKRRDWLRHAYTPRRDRDPAVHALDQISQRFERLSLMIASVILISDRQRDRCMAFEFFLRVALSARGYNNFASLHSIVSALDKVYSGQDGPAIETHVHASDLSWNKWLSLRVLILKSNGGTYKTALKHTSMPLIPTMAIHTSDLVRVMSNQDYKEGDPTLIHWGKFQIIAKIVAQMTEFQDRLRATDDYNFISRPAIATMLDDPKPMTEEMIIEKTFPTPSEPARAATWSARVLRRVLR